jgi:hypothetical protein
MADAVAAPASRNAPCSCGSGKRFKECHGLLAPPEQSGVVADDPLRRNLDAALEAQMAGRFAAARDLYEAVLAAQPDNFDARHMLAVVHFQCGDFDLARTRILDVAALRPLDSAVRRNVDLIESALERRAVEREICRELLPRLAPRCVAPTTEAELRTWGSAGLDMIVLAADMPDRWSELQRVAAWLGAPGCTVWLDSMVPRPPEFRLSTRMIEPAQGAVPEARHAIFFGADRSPAAWLAACNATHAGLYCDSEPACLLVDRIPELARDGLAPIRLLFSSSKQAQRIGLPGAVVDGAD